jgi:hypothetical protein
MTVQKTVLHLISVALLILWGGVMLYFHVSGRIANYLPPMSEGWFRPMALAGGIGLILLGIFNLATLGAEEADDCCGHDHDHDEKHDGHEHHHHEHEHDHAHVHGDGCCGHDHAQPANACGHDHGHSHDHEHGSGDAHAHGILEESGPVGRAMAISILALPILIAAVFTPDRFSAAAVTNKGLYNPNYADSSRAEQFSLRKDPAPVAKPGAASAAVKAVPPADAARVPGSAAPATAATATTTATAKAGSAETSKSFGSFTLEDLKAQVPMSKEGNFILEVPELFYTAGDKEVQTVLTGQSVETIAQVMPEKLNNADGKRLRILRLLVQCCAADARPFSVPIEFSEKAPEFKEMTWVKVVGKMAYQQEGGQTVPLLQATEIKETTAPDQSMLY